MKVYLFLVSLCILIIVGLTAVFCEIYLNKDPMDYQPPMPPEKAQGPFLPGTGIMPPSGEVIDPNDVEVNVTDDDFIYEKVCKDFANKIFQETQQKDNYVVSPLSIYVALSMASNGCEGSTLSEFGNLLCGESFDQDKLNAYNKALLNNAKQIQNYEIANSVWVKDEIEKPFINTMKEQFDSGAYELRGAKEINDWVNEKTKGKIPSIIDRIEPDMIAVLVDAIYFYGKWKIPFNDYFNQIRPFYYENGNTSMIDYMVANSRGLRFELYDDYKGGDVLELYCKNHVSMYFFLPPKGVKLKDYAKKIDFNDLKNLKKYNGDAICIGFIPKFDIAYKLECKDMLEKLGLRKCFSVNFDEMKKLSKNPNGVYYSEVMHKATIEIDEEGVEATAVTAMGAAPGAVGPIGPQPVIKEVVFDHPFAFAIVNKSNDTVVFVGEIYNPKI